MLAFKAIFMAKIQLQKYKYHINTTKTNKNSKSYHTRFFEINKKL